MNEFISQLTPDGIMTLLGSFLGVFLAGIFTLMSVKKQIEHNKSTKKKDDKELTVKILYDVHANSDIYSNKYKKMISRLEEVDNNLGINKETLGEVNSLVEEGVDLENQLNTINYYNLSFDVYPYARVIQKSIKLLHGHLELLQLREKANQDLPLTKNEIDKLQQELNDLKGCLDFINKYIKDNS